MATRPATSSTSWAAWSASSATPTPAASSKPYIHGPDLCFKVTATGALTCYHADAQGNIVRTTGSTGVTINQYAYTPYGRSILTTSDPAATDADKNDPYRFVGSQGVMLEFPSIASSNLYFMRARYYSAEAGVFFATDPVKNIGAGWKAAGYGYASGNPITLCDPRGAFVEFFGEFSAGGWGAFGPWGGHFATRSFMVKEGQVGG